MTINIKTFILGLNLKSCNLQTCFSISYQHININFSIPTGWFADASSLIIAFNQFILISTHACPPYNWFYFRVPTPNRASMRCPILSLLFTLPIFGPLMKNNYRLMKFLYAYIAITSYMFSATKRQIKYRVFVFYFSFKNIFYAQGTERSLTTLKMRCLSL